MSSKGIPKKMLINPEWIPKEIFDSVSECIRGKKNSKEVHKKEYILE